MVFLSPPVSEEPRPPRPKAQTKRRPDPEVVDDDEIVEIPPARSPTKKGKGKASAREPSPDVEDDIPDSEAEATPPPRSKPKSKPQPAKKDSPPKAIDTLLEKDKKGKRKAVDEPAGDDGKSKAKKKKTTSEMRDEVPAPSVAPKKRGRPAKPAPVAPVESDEEAAVSVPKKKKMRKLNAITSFNWEAIKFGVSFCATPFPCLLLIFALCGALA